MTSNVLRDLKSLVDAYHGPVVATRDANGRKMFCRMWRRHTVYYMNIEVGNNKYYLHKRYTEFLMLHQVRKTDREP